MLKPHLSLQGTGFFFKDILLQSILLGLSLLWVYKDEDVIKAVSANPSKPEFLVPSSNPFYRIPYGSSSHYGDHILPVLRSIAQCKGIVHILKHRKLLVDRQKQKEIIPLL